MFQIYGTSSCHYCAMERELLENWGKKYDYTDISDSADLTREFLNKFNDARTVPQIIDPQGYHIGGYNELREWLKDYG